MTPTWFNAVSAFAAFNLLAVPTMGRLTWLGMSRLTESNGPFAGVMLSLVMVVLILLINIALYRWAVRRGLPKPGQMVLFLIIGLTFALPIGTGSFSPINLAINLLG
ncbi:MAG: hypothetical protein AAGE80_12260 [Pseudomonadota bacterium]